MMSRPTFIALTAFQMIALNASALAPEVQQRIVELVKSNPGQMSVEEYSLIAEEIEKRSPCNVLVFGVGRDSQLWIDTNRGGTTLFLEDNSSWIQKTAEQVPELNVHEVIYKTRRSQWREILCAEDFSFLMLDLPAYILDTPWDVIVVDAPAGWADDKPGRMQSIYTTAQLAQKSCDTALFLHDCDRPAEAAFGTKFFGDQHLVQSIGRLRFYRGGAVPGASS